MTPENRRRLGWGLAIAAVAATVGVAVSPAPYVIESPGPVYDTIGDANGTPLIEIGGAETYPTEGELDLLTVNLSGSPDQLPSWAEVARAWYDPRSSVIDLDRIYPPGTTDEDADAESAAQMTDSQQEATAAALRELGYHYTATMTISYLPDDGPSSGVLEVGDVVTSLDGEPLADVYALRAAIARHGADSPAEVGYTRDGVAATARITPEPGPEGNLVIGVAIMSSYDFPVDVTITLDGVGGPSAGMMLALGIYDKLTPGALTGGEHIAGTGTIEADGTVGPIGGIVQKMNGARSDGADWFLAPGSNCAETVGHVPDGLAVFRVDTLDDALAAVEAIAQGETQGLPGCAS